MSDRRSGRDRSEGLSVEDRDDPYEDDFPRPRSRTGAQDARSSAQNAIRRANRRGNKQQREGISSLANRPLALGAALGAGLIVLGIVSYLLFGGSTQPVIQAPTSVPAPAKSTPAPADSGARAGQPQPPPVEDDGSPFSTIFDTQPGTNQPTGSWPVRAARISLKLALAALLAAALAFRPRKDMPIFQRNPYVAQTQILLAVVASAMMMIVADNAARAFGIFAAASLVRFRTNIRDPKEITVLLLCLGIGLASGVGRWEIAIILTLFVLLMLWVLEYYEPAQVYRTMELTVNTRNVVETDEMLKEIFEKHEIEAEVRKLDREDEDEPLGTIAYTVSVNPTVSTDHLSEEIFNADPDNVDGVKWDQKKSTSYIYR